MADIRTNDLPTRIGIWLHDLRARVAHERTQRRAYRQTYEELSAMTDRELDDVGISRIQIGDVAADAARRA